LYPFEDKARFFNLAVGDKVLLKDNFKSPNIFAKPDWTPANVTEIFQRDQKCSLPLGEVKSMLIAVL
jgi:hypothetical protein